MEESGPAKRTSHPKKTWRVRVVPIDARKYPEFLVDREHPFVAMAAEARIRDIDSFCARLWARIKKSEANVTGQVLSAAA